MQTQPFDPARPEPSPINAPGRELDAVVAAKRGWTNIIKVQNPAYPYQEHFEYYGDWPKGTHYTDVDGWHRGKREVIFEYSKDELAALQLVDYARSKGMEVIINTIYFSDNWSVIFRQNDKLGFTRQECRGIALTRPHAICLAFLKLVLADRVVNGKELP